MALFLDPTGEGWQFHPRLPSCTMVFLLTTLVEKPAPKKHCWIQHCKVPFNGINGIKIDQYWVLFPDGTNDYIELDDTDRIEVILENWKIQMKQCVLKTLHFIGQIFLKQWMCLIHKQYNKQKKLSFVLYRRNPQK